MNLTFPVVIDWLHVGDFSWSFNRDIEIRPHNVHLYFNLHCEALSYSTCQQRWNLSTSLHLRFVQHFKFTREKAQNVTFHDQNKTKKTFYTYVATDATDKDLVCISIKTWNTPTYNDKWITSLQIWRFNVIYGFLSKLYMTHSSLCLPFYNNNSNNNGISELDRMPILSLSQLFHNWQYFHWQSYFTIDI